jgi:hypothetical protein
VRRIVQGIKHKKIDAEAFMLLQEECQAPPSGADAARAALLDALAAAEQANAGLRSARQTEDEIVAQQNAIADGTFVQYD